MKDEGVRGSPVFVVLVAVHHGVDVFFCARKGDCPQERFAVGAGRSCPPSGCIACAGVVAGERVGNGVICLYIILQLHAQVPCSGEDVFFGIKQLLMFEGAEAFSVSPFVSGRRHDLHQPDLTRAAAGIGIESALLPPPRSEITSDGRDFWRGAKPVKTLVIQK